MGELPISDEAVRAAATAYADALAAVPEPQCKEPLTLEQTLGAFKAGISAALDAEGFEAEKRGQFFPDERRKGIQVHRDTEQRLTSPWKPIPEQGTDTPSTTDTDDVDAPESAS